MQIKKKIFEEKINVEKLGKLLDKLQKVVNSIKEDIL